MTRGSLGGKSCRSKRFRSADESPSSVLNVGAYLARTFLMMILAIES